jgi:hypothetical protein
MLLPRNRQRDSLVLIDLRLQTASGKKIFCALDADISAGALPTFFSIQISREAVKIRFGMNPGPVIRGGISRAVIGNGRIQLPARHGGGRIYAVSDFYINPAVYALVDRGESIVRPAVLPAAQR